MNKNKSFFLLTFMLAAVLSAVLVIFKEEERKATLSSTPYQTKQATPSTALPKNPILEDLKEQELFDNVSESFSPVFTNNPSVVFKQTQKGQIRPISPNSIAQPSTSYSPQNSNSSLEIPEYEANTPMYNQPIPSLETSAALPTPSYSTPSVSSRSTNATHIQSYQRGETLAPTIESNEVTQKKVQGIFSPYMASLTKEQADQLEKSLDGLTDRVEDAIRRALMPKSKKESNIEKYLARNNTADTKTTNSQTTQAGPFAQVEKQIAKQKNKIVSNMQSAFGAKAGKQAGALMDLYSQELFNVLNQTNLSPEERQKQVRKISRKYNKKLHDLSAQKGKEKLQSQLDKRDNDLLAHYKKSYDEKTATELASIMDKYRAQEIELTTQGLVQDEYFDKAFALYRERDEAMRKYLTENKKSLSAYINAPRQQETQEESDIPYVASEKEQQARQDDIVQRSSSLLEQAQQIYGQEGVSAFQGIYQQYANEMAQIWADTETTRQQKEELSQQALKKNNDNTTRAQLKLEEERYVDAVRKTLADQPANVQQQAEKHVRAVLDDMNTRIDGILGNPNLTEEQRQAQIKQARQTAMKQLTGQ